MSMLNEIKSVPARHRLTEDDDITVGMALDALAAVDAITAEATQPEWSIPHFAIERSVAGQRGCDCRYVLCEGYGDAVATIGTDNGIKLVAEGGNDGVPLMEARANARLIVMASSSFVPMLAIVRATLHSEGTNVGPGHEYILKRRFHDVFAPIIRALDDANIAWRK